MIKLFMCVVAFFNQVFLKSIQMLKVLKLP